jgi:diguanylate cyclase (GGDEF)-like protein
MEVDALVHTEVLDAVANGVFVVNGAGRIIVWNRWMVDLSGIPAAEAIGRSVSDVFPVIAGTRFEHALQQALSHRLAGLLAPSIHRPVLPLYRRAEDRAGDNRIRQLINLSPIRLGADNACVVHVQDMTAVVLRERRLHQQAAELASANAALQAKLDEVQTLQWRLVEMQHRDALTGVYNRTFENEALENELTDARRQGRPLTLVLLDIDHLKAVNDTYGQHAGDEVLRGLGKRLNAIDVPQATASRHGDEEFMVILPGIDVATAAGMAQDWLEAFAATDFPFGDFVLKATLSAGVAGYPEHGKSAAELLQCVELACYLAKHDGRNRVVVFDSSIA